MEDQKRGNRRPSKRPSKRPRENVSLPSGQEFILEEDEDFFCSACLKTVARQGLEEHFKGRIHKNMEKLELFYPFLLKHGLSWMEGRKSFRCDKECCQRGDLPANYEELEHHVFKKHFSTLQPFYPPPSPLGYRGSQVPKIIHGNQGAKQTKRFWKNFDLPSAIPDFKKLTGPTTILSNGGNEFLLQIVNGEFNESDVKEMTTLALYLEKKGNRVRKDDKKEGIKGGTKMMCSGFRHGQGYIGR